ncbi:hypothetical protein LEP1GSC047_0517 [Leptospira inadai serovar Lyme str. 10]|uniref:Uncharacterized protein n=1 Tax=Leptospira inadai serovar Lyme str. 10 TaxID=1049790 RepID=V6HB63_9LEPT|nr:hypothetical protein LEP1GSC047_0517 [Leptospira inadai serovar Lyme str. 10]
MPLTKRGTRKYVGREKLKISKLGFPKQFDLSSQYQIDQNRLGVKIIQMGRSLTFLSLIFFFSCTAYT